MRVRSGRACANGGGRMCRVCLVVAWGCLVIALRPVDATQSRRRRLCAGAPRDHRCSLFVRLNHNERTPIACRFVLGGVVHVLYLLYAAVGRSVLHREEATLNELSWRKSLWRTLFRKSSFNALWRSSGMSHVSQVKEWRRFRGTRQEARGKTDSGIVGMAMSSGSIDRRTDHMRC